MIVNILLFWCASLWMRVCEWARVRKNECAAMRYKAIAVRRSATLSNVWPVIVYSERWNLLCPPLAPPAPNIKQKRRRRRRRNKQKRCSHYGDIPMLYCEIHFGHDLCLLCKAIIRNVTKTFNARLLFFCQWPISQLNGWHAVAGTQRSVCAKCTTLRRIFSIKISEQNDTKNEVFVEILGHTGRRSINYLNFPKHSTRTHQSFACGRPPNQTEKEEAKKKTIRI